MSTTLRLQSEVPLAPLLTLRTGGNARHFVEAANITQLLDALDWARSRSLPLLPLGGGSNLICPDTGFNGLVVRLALRGIQLEKGPQADVSLVRAAAGENWDAFVEWCTARGLAGLECLSGIPGTVGATPIQNVGAYGQDVAQCIHWVEALDLGSKEVVRFDNATCRFAYRSSRFKSEDRERYVVTSVCFRLRQGGAPNLSYPALAEAIEAPYPSLLQVRQAVLAVRRSRSMLFDEADPNHRSCGSFFVNPQLSEQAHSQFLAQLGPLGAPPVFPGDAGQLKIPAAWLIEHAGFTKGKRRGNVGLSTQHTLCLVCHPGASTRELLDFAAEIQRQVQSRFGIILEMEPRIAGVTSATRPPGQPQN